MLAPMRLGFEHRYAAMPGAFHVPATPAPVPAPRLLAWNEPLALALGLDTGRVKPVADRLFSGAGLPEDAQPVAMAYAGHQYAHFVPALGDGRALLLGELRHRDGGLRDVQLKGSGRTVWSRSGDGLAAVGPMLREYLVSEFMHAMHIPTTRSLAVVATGVSVRREESLPGAVLTRVAASHVRVGTFEYFAARGDTASLSTLLQFCIERHYPELGDDSAPALALLRAVTARQAELVAAWMSVGFIHGVMNTDNMAISGETIDYGPCAFMDQYDPQTVFSSIDHRGRYSYGNQPAVAQWNLARLAECLLPLMPGEAQSALEQATEVVKGFLEEFETAFSRRMREKLGLTRIDTGDAALVGELLQLMRGAGADFTLTFRQLADALHADASVPTTLAASAEAARDWLLRWHARLATEPVPPGTRRNAMQQVNPAFIPRNHRVEAALAAASDAGDMAPFETLLALLQAPCSDHPGRGAFMQPAADHERVLRTFCGT